MDPQTLEQWRQRMIAGQPPLTTEEAQWRLQQGDPGIWKPFNPNGPAPTGLQPSTRGNLIATPEGPVGPPAPPGTPTGPAPETVPGSDVYDWYRVNEALVSAGLNGWRIAGTNHKPTNIGKWVQNPDWIEGDDPAKQFIMQPGQEWVIGVVSPDGRLMTKVTMSRSQPDEAGNYSFTALDRGTPSAIEAQGGYKDVQRVPFQDGHQEYWGTNVQTGAFEPMPGMPSGIGDPNATKGWNDLRQIEQIDPQGNAQLVWVGTPPGGGVPQVVPGWQPISAPNHDNIRQTTIGGRQVYVGRNKATNQWEPIPGLGAGPLQTTTVGGRVYVENPSAGQPGQPAFIPATGISQPTDDATQWVDAGNGYVKKQVYRNGNWSDDPSEAWRLVDPTRQRAEGAILPRGTRYEVQTQDGRLLTVEADGNGGYTIPPDTRSRAIPGAPISKPVTATSADQEFITRYNPETQQQETVKNPNWAPALIGDRMRQLRQLAAQKQAELSQRVANSNGTYTDAQAHEDFNSWWDQEITPRQQQIQFDIEQQRQGLEAKQQADRIAAYQAAQGVGQNAVLNYQAQQKNMVGPNWGSAYFEPMMKAIRTGAPAPDVPASAFQYQGYDLNQLAQYYTAQALQHISPTAAGMLGTQPTAAQAALGQNPFDLLNRSAFQPSGAQAQPQITINVGGAQPQPAPSTVMPAFAPVAAAPAVAPATEVAAATPAATPTYATAPVASAPSSAVAPEQIYSDAATRATSMGLGSGGVRSTYPYTPSYPPTASQGAPAAPAATPIYDDSAARAAFGLGAGGLSGSALGDVNLDEWRQYWNLTNP